MASDPPSYTHIEGPGPHPNKAIVSFGAGKSEIISRIFGVILPLFPLIFMSIALGFNNSPEANDLPDTFEGCSYKLNISTLDPDFLRRSVNIFCGIWIPFTAIAAIYQVVVIILRFLNFGCINNNFRCFITIDIVVSHLLVYIAVGGILGGYLLGWWWSQYVNGVDDQITGDVQRAGSVVTGLMYGTFGGCLGLFIFHLNYLINMTVYSAKGRNCKVTEYNCNLKTPPS